VHHFRLLLPFNLDDPEYLSGGVVVTPLVGGVRGVNYDRTLDYRRIRGTGFDLDLIMSDTMVSPQIEPQSERERTILRLLADGLTNREIADRLYLSYETIK
jgi:hypothetical protein